ncbi:MAG: hypothetical protein APR53_01105 [Methanoculleus sp. SDB]|nr:MAG: hypothetical protein APR53_01105 [Methanoculleus sp. SDB]
MVLENGTAYRATVEVADADTYTFVEQGLLGERIPITVSDVRVFNETGDVAFDDAVSSITFPKGTYTITYTGPVRDSTLQATFDRPYDIELIIPSPFHVENPLLGMVSPGAEIIEENGTVTVRWEQVRSFESRFYDPGREQALIIFGTFWIALCALFLVPYLLMNRRS